VSLIGSLEQFDLANILRRIEVFSKTGLLVAKQGELWVEFYFRQGQLVCVGPMRANVTLVDRLLQAQLLSIQSLPRVKQIVNFSETNETRIALTLINEGLLSREVLRAWSSHETSQILQTIISWSTGEVYFEDDCPTPADRLLIALSVSALLEALPAAMLAPRPAATSAPSTDELTHTPAHDASAMFTPSSSTLVEVGPGGQMNGTPFAQDTFNASQLIDQPPAFNQPNMPMNGGGTFNASQFIDQSVAFNQPNPAAFSQPNPPMNGGGMINASQLIDPPAAFNQPNPAAFNQPITPMNGGGMLNASQLIEDFPFNQASAGGPVNTSQLIDDMPPPSFASANPSAMFGPEIDISASAQISILPPQPVRNPLPPARIDTSFMTPELVLAPVDLSTLRERNPQVQLTPDQWSLFGLIDGQVPLQALCQALNAPAEQICMVAGELIAIGLVMPLNPTTGALSEIMSQSAQYPAYVPQPPAMPGPNPFAMPVEAQSQWGNGQNGAPFLSGGGWQQGSAYAPVGGYR
jgi:hypothetical protein